MITRIEALRYRSLRRVETDVRRFQALVGPNASGKSAFLDVVSLLSDFIKMGNPVDPLIPKRASYFDELLWNKQGSIFELAVEARIPEELQARFADRNFHLCRYEVAFEQDAATGEVSMGPRMWFRAPSIRN